MDVNLKNFGALIYYYRSEKEALKDYKQFEKLTPDEQKSYINEAGHMINILDKLNYAVNPKGVVEQLRNRRQIDVTSLSMWVKEWIQKHVKKPKGAADMFPWGEFAVDILKHFEERNSEIRKPLDVI